MPPGGTVWKPSSNQMRDDIARGVADAGYDLPWLKDVLAKVRFEYVASAGGGVAARHTHGTIQLQGDNFYKARSREQRPWEPRDFAPDVYDFSIALHELWHAFIFLFLRANAPFAKDVARKFFGTQKHIQLNHLDNQFDPDGLFDDDSFEFAHEFWGNYVQIVLEAAGYIGVFARCVEEAQRFWDLFLDKYSNAVHMPGLYLRSHKARDLYFNEKTTAFIREKVLGFQASVSSWPTRSRAWERKPREVVAATRASRAWDSSATPGSVLVPYLKVFLPLHPQLGFVYVTQLGSPEIRQGSDYALRREGNRLVMTFPSGAAQTAPVNLGKLSTTQVIVGDKNLGLAFRDMLRPYFKK